MKIHHIDDLFQKLWDDYTLTTPQAKAIHDLFEKKGEAVVNDHIALRTYNLPEVNIEKMAQVFLKHGYTEKGSYLFEEKKLTAKHFEHQNPEKPKVFISQLKTEEFSPFLQETAKALVKQMPTDLPNEDDFVIAGRPWNVDYATYEKLYEESEYAAWVAAFGFRANHFTVHFNYLKSFEELSELNQFLKDAGFKLNSSGGEIKGTPEVYLEQSSTMASEVDVSFKDGTHKIPSCYYEFAKRYTLPDGQLYQGFVAQSADKIFESTNRA